MEISQSLSSSTKDCDPSDLFNPSVLVLTVFGASAARFVPCCPLSFYSGPGKRAIHSILQVMHESDTPDRCPWHAVSADEVSEWVSREKTFNNYLRD